MADWEQQTDPTSGKVFYVNHATQQTSWTLPVNLPLPQGWEENRDEQGRTYFSQPSTGKRSWQDPRLGASPASSSYPSLATPTSFTQASTASAPLSEQRFQLLPASNSGSNNGNSSTWSCPSCTLQNSNSSNKCQACDASRPGGSGLLSDEALAAALQAELDGEDYASPKKPKSFTQSLLDGDSSNGLGESDYLPTVSEPFELQPNMVPDETSTSCLKCGVVFGTFTNRRHHCRCCGILSCHNCSSKKALVRLPLNKEEMNEREQRCCDWCFDHLGDGHAHCLYRYVVLASREDYENRPLAIRGIADVMENLPHQLQRKQDRAQAMRDLEVLKFVGGVAKMCSFLSPGDTAKAQTESCRLLVALASASCVPELDTLALPKRQVASELCEGAALNIMEQILTQRGSEHSAVKVSVVRVLYLLGDVVSLKTAVREVGLVAPLCDSMLSEDSQLQDWSCMTVGRLLKNDKQMLEAVISNQGVHNLILLLGSTNAMIQEHAALAIQDAMILFPDKVKRAMQGFSGTAACVSLIKSREPTVISAGLRLLLVLPESECAQVRSLQGVSALVAIMGSNASSENQILALQVLCHIANASSLDRHAIAQSGGLATAVDLMKTSQNSFVKREATNLVDILSNDADGASQIVQASGGIQSLVSEVRSQSEASSSAGNALSLLLLQGADAQQAMLESGALEALLGAVRARGDVVQASRVVEATFTFLSDPALVPKLLKSISPPVLMQALVQLSNGMSAQLPPHTIEMLLLALAMLCNAKPTDYQMGNEEEEEVAAEGEQHNAFQPTAAHCRNLLCAHASPTLAGWVKTFSLGEPGVALAAVRCMLASATPGANADRLCANLPVIVQCMAECEPFGNDLSSPKGQLLVHSFSLFARLVNGTSNMSVVNQDALRQGLVLLNQGLALAEPECMLTAVRALRFCSIQSQTWKTIADYSLPRCLEILLADKSKRGPGGRDPLSSFQVLQLLMDVSEICRNLSKLEVYSNCILDGGGVLALVGLLSESEIKCTSSGLATLSALAASSKRCAQAVAQNATLPLLHLEESNRNGHLPISLLCRLVEQDASTAAMVAQVGGTEALDMLLRLVQFDQSQDAVTVLCHMSSASDLVFEHIVSIGDVSTAVLMLNATTVRRVQGKACQALAQLCDGNISLHSTNDLVLHTALPIMIGFLTPVDVLGSDKSESPGMEAVGAIAHICRSAVAGGDELARSSLFKALDQLDVVRASTLLLMRERRLGRSKSQSTASALHCIRQFLALSHHLDAGKFWQAVAGAGKPQSVDDLFSALVLALDAHLVVVNADSLVVIDDVCWVLSAFPEGIAPDALARLGRPLAVALDKCISQPQCRLSCLRAMARAIREPALSSTSLLGSVRGITAAMLNGMEREQQVETALLLAGLLRGAASQDRLIQDLVANSGAIPLMMELFASSNGMEMQQQQTLACLATMIEFGGNAVKRAIRKVCGENELVALNSLVEDEDRPIQTRHTALKLVAKLASLDESRQDFVVFKSTCFHVVETKQPAELLQPSIELLTWFELCGEDVLEQMLLDLVGGENGTNNPARLEALNALAYFASRTGGSRLTFPPRALTEFKQKALFALQAVAARVNNFPALLPNLVQLAKEVEGTSSQTELVSAVLFEASHKNAELRHTICHQSDLVKVLREKPNLGELWNAQRLLRLLGDEFQLPVATASTLANGGGSSKPQQMVDKRKQEQAMSLPPPAPSAPNPVVAVTPKGLFPIFSGPQSAQEKSSLDLAMRLQQLELPPPSFPSSSLTSLAPSVGNKWNCSLCTFENDASDTNCLVCDGPKPGGGQASTTLIATTKVRCQTCMSELLASNSSPKFKCSTCGTVSQIRDCKI
ncbi:hypothetical protein BASA81_001809 [Batrachochytrium salamandrivorans]|nr:hypothetical protein BASA81_001809 [Batrachochytrium salamandrivorans]